MKQVFFRDFIRENYSRVVYFIEQVDLCRSQVYSYLLKSRKIKCFYNEDKSSLTLYSDKGRVLRVFENIRVGIFIKKPIAKRKTKQEKIFYESVSDELKDPKSPLHHKNQWQMI